MRIFILAPAVGLFAVACAGPSSTPAATAATSKSTTPSSRDSQEARGANPEDGPAYSVCEPTFVRQRQCQDVFLPALVDLRVRLDVPAGIAATAAEQGRDALVATAKEEFASDSTDEQIAATCGSIRANAPAEFLETAERQSARCLETADDCDAFVECILPVVEAGITAPRP